MAHDPALLGIFPDLDDLLAALRRVKEEDGKILTVFSPIHFSEIQEIIGHKTSSVRYLTLAGGILGGTSLVGLAVYAHLSFQFDHQRQADHSPHSFSRALLRGDDSPGGYFHRVFPGCSRADCPGLDFLRPMIPASPKTGSGFWWLVQTGERDILHKLLKDAGAEEVRDVSG